MVYTFRIVSDEVDNFKREIKIDANSNFLQLRNALCDAVGYDRAEMSSFYICDQNWEKEQEITLEDMSQDSSEEVFLMDETPLDDFLEDEGQRLTWIFDYLTNRCLFIELKKIETGKMLLEPLCTLSMGKAPAQHVDFDEFTKDLDAKAATAAAAASDDLDEEFYGQDGYNEDEIEDMGYDEPEY